MTLVVIGAILILLFSLAYVTKRRFGVLGLGLAAGTLLSANAKDTMADFLQIGGLPVTPFSYDTASAILLTLLPALLLMLGGPKYTKKKTALVGSVAFAVLGTILLLGPLTTVLPTSDVSVRALLDVLAQYQSGIIATAIAIAVLDTIFAHGAKPVGKLSKH